MLQERFNLDGSFIRTIDTEKRMVSGMVATPAVTVDGRRIAAGALDHPTALTEFLRVPLFLWNHNPDYPIGRIKRLENRSGAGLWASGIVDDEMIWNWILQGRIRGFSIGFKVLDWSLETESGEPISAEEARLDNSSEFVFVFNKIQLFDISVVSSPANTYCLFVEPHEMEEPEYSGFPEQLRKSAEGFDLTKFERVARSEDLPLYLPKRDHFDMYMPFERNGSFLKEKLEAAGVPYDPTDWWVYGYATRFDEVDSYGTRMTRTAIEKALDDYAQWKNVREQHDHHKAVGVAPLLQLDKSGLFIAARISKGAPDTWQKVLDGTLKGFSLGGVIKPNGIIEVRENGRTIKNIVDVELSEISLVDRPAVRSCGFTLACRDIKEDSVMPETDEVLVSTESVDDEENEVQTPKMSLSEIQELIRALSDDSDNYQTTSLDHFTRGANGDPDLPLDMDRSWDSRAAEKRVRAWADAEDGPNAKYRRAFFWYDESAPENFTSYKLPFADVVDGRLTAIWRGVVAAMIALKGGRGGVDIPDEDRRAVYNRIAAYYRKADKEPPEFEAEYEGEMDLEGVLDESDLPEQVKVEPANSEALEITERLMAMSQKLDDVIAACDRLSSDIAKMNEHLEKVIMARQEESEETSQSSEEKTEVPESGESSEFNRAAGTELHKKIEEQNALIRDLKKALERFGEGRKATDREDGSASRKSIWDGVVPDFPRFARGRSGR